MLACCHFWEWQAGNAFHFLGHDCGRCRSMNKIDFEFAASASATSPRLPTNSSGRIPELDGARGMAVLLVVIEHYFGWVEHGFAVLQLGVLGVNLFFVLSGFLIGSIILEHRSSSNFFRVFYARRALRILPVYFLTLTATLAFIWVANAPWAGQPLPASSYFTFTQNFVMAARGDYGTILLSPTWTLAVEEQFYLLIPLLILFLPTRALLPSIIGGIAFFPLMRALLYVMTGDKMSAQILVFGNGDILLIGVLAAYAHQNIKMQEITLRIIPLVSIVGILSVGSHAEMLGGKLTIIAVPMLVAAFFASYVLLAAKGWQLLRFLRARFWTTFGTISYCLYLIHQPVNCVMHGLIFGATPDIATLPQIVVTCAALFVCLAISAASWTLVEAPLLRFGRSLHYADEPTSL